MEMEIENKLMKKAAIDYERMATIWDSMLCKFPNAGVAGSYERGTLIRSIVDMTGFSQGKVRMGLKATGRI